MSSAGPKIGANAETANSPFTSLTVNTLINQCNKQNMFR